MANYCINNTGFTGIMILQLQLLYNTKLFLRTRQFLAGTTLNLISWWNLSLKVPENQISSSLALVAVICIENGVVFKEQDTKLYFSSIFNIPKLNFAIPEESVVLCKIVLRRSYSND